MHPAATATVATEVCFHSNQSDTLSPSTTLAPDAHDTADKPLTQTRAALPFDGEAVTPTSPTHTRLLGSAVSLASLIHTAAEQQRRMAEAAAALAASRALQARNAHD